MINGISLFFSFLTAKEDMSHISPSNPIKGESGTQKLTETQDYPTIQNHQTEKRRSYTQNFKAKVGKLAKKLDCNSSVARFYEVNEANVRLWRKKYGDDESINMNVDPEEMEKMKAEVQKE